MSSTPSNSSSSSSFRQRGKRIRVPPLPYRIVEVIDPRTNSINFIKVWNPLPPPTRPPQRTWSHSDVDSTDGEVSDGGRTKKKQPRKKRSGSKMPEAKAISFRESYPQTEMRHGGTKALIALGFLAVTFVVSWKGMGGNHS